MTNGSHVTDLTAGYALGALSPDERGFVETHIATCQECRGDVRELFGIASTLPLACDSVAPPGGLKARVLNAAAGDARAAEALTRRGAASSQGVLPDRMLGRADRPFRSAPWSWWLAGAATAAALFLGAVDLNSMHERSALKAQVDSMSRSVSDLADANARLTEQAAQGHAVMTALANGTVWTTGPNRDQRGQPWSCTIVQPPERGHNGMLLAMMPAPPNGMAYQVWLRHKGAARKAGMVMHGGMSMLDLSMPVARGDVVAFSVEPMQGSTRPTSPYVMQVAI